MDNKQKEYKVEPHAHTKEVSRCGHLGGAELARLYADSGYSTLFITDHLFTPFFERLGDMPWEEKLLAHKKGYEEARREGEKHNLCVLYAVELRLDACENDYLVYGLSDSFFKAHANLVKLDLPALSTLVRANGGLILEAHPTRAPKSFPTPEYVDGFEVHNANPRHRAKSDYAREKALAKEYGLLRSGGSDAHRTEDVGCGGMVFPRPIQTVEDFIRALKMGEGRIL